MVQNSRLIPHASYSICNDLLTATETVTDPDGKSVSQRLVRSAGLGEREVNCFMAGASVLLHSQQSSGSLLSACPLGLASVATNPIYLYLTIYLGRVLSKYNRLQGMGGRRFAAVLTEFDVPCRSQLLQCFAHVSTGTIYCILLTLLVSCATEPGTRVSPQHSVRLQLPPWFASRRHAGFAAAGRGWRSVTTPHTQTITLCDGRRTRTTRRWSG